MFVKRSKIQILLQEYEALLRKDFSSFTERSFYEINPQTRFLPNWHIEKIAQELEECRLGNTKRLIINLPPRSLKSHCASVAFPRLAAWAQSECSNHLRLLRARSRQYPRGPVSHIDV